MPVAPRITSYRLEYRNDPNAAWQVAHQGGKAGKDHKAEFTPVTARYVRLHTLDATFAPTIWEFQLFDPKRAVTEE